MRLHRRGLIGSLGIVGLVGCSAPAIIRSRESQVIRPFTAFQTEGPFYPYDDKPTDQDGDLVRVTGLDAQAQGQVSHVTGTACRRNGAPLAGALIEIWQCDHGGRYIHRDDPNVARPRDAAFQGYGKVLTDAQGGFRFRTIKPVSYEATLQAQPIWRTPHIHVAISTRDVRRLTSQLYVAGEPLNVDDILLRDLTDGAQRDGIVRPYTPADDIEAGALKVHYDLVVPI